MAQIDLSPQTQLSFVKTPEAMKVVYQHKCIDHTDYERTLFFPIVELIWIPIEPLCSVCRVQFITCTVEKKPVKK